MWMFLFLLRFVLGVYLVVTGYTDVSLGEASTKWPTVKGSIIHAEKVTVQGRYGSHEEASITYLYKVGTHVYTSRCIRFGGVNGADPNELLQQYGQRTAVVHYDAQEPNHSCLIAGVADATPLMFVIGGAILVLLAFADPTGKQTR